MSQPFTAIFIAEGSAAEVKAFDEFFDADWAEMNKTDTVLAGFRWCQKECPEASIAVSGEAVLSRREFVADGSKMPLYLMILSLKFPALRFALCCADSSAHEWLALAALAENKTVACAWFKHGQRGFFRPSGEQDLLSRLEQRLPDLSVVIAKQLTDEAATKSLGADEVAIFDSAQALGCK